MRKKKILILLTLFFLVFITACSSARRGEPISGPMQLSTSKLQDGEQVFTRTCNQCHPGGEAGLGPALNNKPLPVFLMKFQVRNGLGAMPPFSKEQISDKELDDVMDYVVALRHHK
jgi:mono/diheme cytochrome c family protein